MVVDNKFVRWDSKKHPATARCEATVSTGQCYNCKSEGSDYCPIHGANKAKEAKNKEAVRNYRLLRWQKRISEMTESEGIKSLREEIGILRMILEEMLNQCSDSMDLLMYSQRMSELVMKIEKLVVSCDKLENRMGLLLSKDSVLQLAATYVQIINNYVVDPNIIEQISQDMLQATEQLEDPVQIGA